VPSPRVTLVGTQAERIQAPEAPEGLTQPLPPPVVQGQIEATAGRGREAAPAGWSRACGAGGGVLQLREGPPPVRRRPPRWRRPGGRFRSRRFHPRPVRPSCSSSSTSRPLTPGGAATADRQGHGLGETEMVQRQRNSSTRLCIHAATVRPPMPETVGMTATTPEHHPRLKPPAPAAANDHNMAAEAAAATGSPPSAAR
jgi:hypothetical protein